jgi:hypothetical protein
MNAIVGPLLLAVTVFGSAGQTPQPQTARVSGRVLAEGSNEPLADARVSLIIVSSAPPGTRLPTAPETTTDRSGGFVLDAVPPGQYFIGASKRGYSTPPPGITRRIDLPPGQALSGIDILLQQSAAIAGRVTDPAGNPLLRAIVRVFNPGTTPDGAVTVPTTAQIAETDDRGNFRIADVPTGAHYVVATFPTVRNAFEPPTPPRPAVLAPTFFPSTRDLAAAQLVSVQAGHDVDGINIAMVSAPAFAVSGRIVDANGDPLPRIIVTLIVWPTTQPERVMTGLIAVPAGYPERWVASVASDADGRFSIPNVPSGTYRLTASTPFVPASALLQTSQTIIVGADLTSLRVVLK